MVKLTVITITYNNLQGLRRTLPTIFSQTYTDYEMIVIDGGSTDGSKEYIKKQTRIDQWISEPDNGIYDAMNKAVRMAHGEFCIFMNSGDMFFSPLALEDTVPLLKDADIYTGASVYVNNDKEISFMVYPPKEITLDFMIRFALSHQATFCKTEILRLHPFNENHKIVSDWEFSFIEWYKYHRTYQSLPTTVAIYFLDGISSCNIKLSKAERKEVMKQLFDADMYDNIINGKYKHLWYDIDTAEEERIRVLRRKIDIAMSKKPLARDWKIIRNIMKVFIADLVRSI